MKRSFIALTFALLACAADASADVVSDMIGSWICEQTLVNGDQTISSTGSAKSVRYGTKGLQTTATVKVGDVTASSVGWLHDSGTCLGYVKQGSQTIAVMDGTWKVSGKTLVTAVTVHTTSGDYTQTTTSIKLANGRIQADSTTSTGLKVKQISRR